ncbi:MAG: AAA family ATPase [Gaiellaceae bacterium]
MLARKTVTVLFCDVADWTPLGEQLDPESLQRVMGRWFTEARAIIERHGGTVEKFIGDEVMAVFGVPLVHEDDALRAVRAASEMREGLRVLNEKLAPAFGVRLEVRMGVNTGEVVAGDPASGSTFVTGDAVTLAKRLEQAAGPGEILIGKATYPLVRDAVRAGPLESFRVKGKAKPVAPWRIDSVDAEAAGVARRLDAPLVGRGEELARLRAAYDAAVAEQSCRTLTVLGAAGIGKSRLAQELAARVETEARVLSGRCLPYGEGITFWPLVDILRELGGDEALAELLAGCDDRHLVVERVRAATGAAEGVPGDELFWAVRRLVETLAAERPLLLIFEDIHWAEATFLDLLEYLHGWTEGAPVLLLCLARPDLLERRPGWTAPRERVETLALAPLAEADAEALLADLAADLDSPARARVLASAEGNPLYVEQMAALAESGELVIPPTIQALLAERLDRLEGGERAILERAAIVGREFSRRQVTDLCPPELRPDVGRHLLALARKELIRPQSSASSREDGFSFRHGLIRDAAYEAMPKEARALFHEWFADWMERNAGEGAPELEELVGYHLEQAVRLREQLGPADARTRGIRDRAGRRLGAAARRALTRDDAPAAAALLRRAIELLPEGDPERFALRRALTLTLWELGAADAAGQEAAELLTEASARGDRVSAAHARLELPEHRLYTADPEAARDAAIAAVEIFGEVGDRPGLAYAWRRLASAERRAGRFGESERAAREALGHARAAQDRREESAAVDALCNSLLYGPTRVGDALAECKKLLQDDRISPSMQANVLSTIAGLETMRGDFERARRAYDEAARLFEELGLQMPLAGLTQVGVPMELLAGDPQAAEREARRGLEILKATGLGAVQGPLLAEALLAQGRLEEAERALGELGDNAPQLPPWQVKWRAVRARLEFARDRVDSAVELANEAVTIAGATDDVTMRAEALHVLADALAAAGRSQDAAAAADQARRSYEAKGHSAGARQLTPAVTS